MNLLDLKADMVRIRIRQRHVAVMLDISESRFSDILNGYKPVDSSLQRQIREAIEKLIDQRTLLHI